jgi:putative phosphoesterase
MVGDGGKAAEVDSMRLLVISDLHANSGALDAVSETVDAVVVLGDLVDYGPDPTETIAWVRAHASWVVRGNHDHAVATGTPTGAGAAWLDLAEASAAWTREALSADERAYLGGLPVSLAFTFGGARFAAFHAAPSDPLYRYLPPETDEATWRSELEAVQADWLLLGHTHRPIVRRVGATTVVNPGSVGQPRAGIPMATYAIWDDGDVHLLHRSYDVERVIARLALRPGASEHQGRLARTLRSGQIGGAGEAGFPRPTT